MVSLVKPPPPAPSPQAGPISVILSHRRGLLGLGMLCYLSSFCVWCHLVFRKPQISKKTPKMACTGDFQAEAILIVRGLAFPSAHRRPASSWRAPHRRQRAVSTLRHHLMETHVFSHRSVTHSRHKDTFSYPILRSLTETSPPAIHLGAQGPAPHSPSLWRVPSTFSTTPSGAAGISTPPAFQLPPRNDSQPASALRPFIWPTALSWEHPQPSSCPQE